MVAVTAGCGADGDAVLADSQVDAHVDLVDSGTIDSTVRDDVPPVIDTGLADRWEPGPALADRALTVLFGAPDLPGRFVCLGAFGPTSDPAALDAPASFLPSVGALGVPSTADLDPTKTTPFEYGRVVPIPTNADLIAALKVFKVVVYFLDENPAKSGSTCGKQWKNVKADPKRWKLIEPNTIKTNEHLLLSLSGCNGAASAGDVTGTCGAVGNFEIRADKLAVKKPESPADATIGFQFLHLSQFWGFDPAAGVDVYLATGVGTMSYFKIAAAAKLGNLAATVAGAHLPSTATKDNSFLVVAPAGGSTCVTSGAPTTECPNWTLPFSTFLDPVAGYPRTGGGLFPKTSQIIALLGSPFASATGTSSLRIAFVRAATWP